jgi:hypothetical protein
VQDAWDERGRGVQEAEMRFEIVIVRGRGQHRGPQDRVVVREEGEDNAQEETGCWLGGLVYYSLVASLPLGSVEIGDAMDLRQTMRKVANDPLLKAIVKFEKADGIVLRGRKMTRGKVQVLQVSLSGCQARGAGDKDVFTNPRLSGCPGKLEQLM